MQSRELRIDMGSSSRSRLRWDCSLSSCSTTAPDYNFFFCKAFTRSGVRILAQMGCIATVPTCALTKATCSHVSIYRKGSRGLSTLYAMQTNSYTLCMMYHARRFRRPWSGFEMAQHLTTREFPRTDRRFSSLFLYAVILPR